MLVPLENALILFICGLLLLWTIFRPKPAAMAFLVVILFAPLGQFREWTPRMEQFVLPLLFLPRILLSENTAQRIINPSSLWILVLWLLWVVVSGLIGGGLDIISSSGWLTGVGGLARFLVVAFFFYSFDWTSDDLYWVNQLFVLSAIPIAVFSLGQLAGFDLVRDATLAWYNPWTSSVVESQYEAELSGSLFRAVGVFGNVAPAASYYILVLFVGLHLIIQGKTGDAPLTRFLIFGGVMAALVGGLSTLSGTFVGGLATLPGVLLLVHRRGTRMKDLFLLGIILAGSVCVAYVVIQSEEAWLDQLSYQVGGLITGERLRSRYADTSGILWDAWELVMSNPLIGASGRQESVFVGDSLYIVLLFTGGFVGLALFMIGALTISVLSWRSSAAGRLTALWLLGSLLVGISANGMFLARLGDWWWAVQGIALSIVRSNRAGTGKTSGSSGLMKSSQPVNQFVKAL
jgi:hypothetical protein